MFRPVFATLEKNCEFALKPKESQMSPDNSLKSITYSHFDASGTGGCRQTSTFNGKLKFAIAGVKSW
jgi:hypothetical protein